MKTEVIIIGGSFAGLSAAMPLVRGRRQVVLIDANSPRNRFAKKSHGVFCIDGKAPAEIRSTALSQLSAYPTFQVVEQTATKITQTPDGFVVTLNNGETYEAKKLILAMGVTDQLPDIVGLKEHWGTSVIHCPYCHGYELRDGALGVLATSEMAFHQAVMIPDWGVTTLFTQGQFNPDGEILAQLIRRDVAIEKTAITQILGDGEQIHAVCLTDGRQIPLNGLYVAPNVVIDSPLLQSLNLETLATPMGVTVKVNNFKESSIKGVFVAGDLSNPMQNATLAISSGMMAGVSAHRALIFND